MASSSVLAPCWAQVSAHTNEEDAVAREIDALWAAGQLQPSNQ
mgnify:CR=1 FL=1